MIKTYWLLHRLCLLQQGKKGTPDPQQQGLSLLECLVAMLIISLVMIAITPAIFLVTASRVQNRKAEQAMQLAQAEIDRVRTLVERGDYTLADLPDDIGGADIKGAPLPSAVLGQVKSAAPCRTYTGARVPAASLLPVDAYRPPSAFVGTPLQPGDEPDNCTPEFLIQTFRTTGVIPTGGTVPTGFQMGVRVYSDNPILRSNLGKLQANQQQAPSLKMASGPGAQGIRPLSVLYSTIVRNDTNQRALQDYKTLCSANGKC